jgi:hypothetical protein
LLQPVRGKSGRRVRPSSKVQELHQRQQVSTLVRESLNQEKKLKGATKNQTEETQVSSIVNVFEIHTLQLAQEDGLLFVGTSSLLDDEPDEDLLITLTFNQVKEMYYYLQAEMYKNKLNQVRL